MIQVQDNGYIQPETVITTTSDNSGEYTIAINKPKRKRREWIYKDDYDKLKATAMRLAAAAIIGWTLFVLMILI